MMRQREWEGCSERVDGATSGGRVDVRLAVSEGDELRRLGGGAPHSAGATIGVMPGAAITGWT